MIIQYCTACYGVVLPFPTLALIDAGARLRAQKSYKKSPRTLSSSSTLDPPLPRVVLLTSMCLSAPLELSLSLSGPYLDHCTLSSLSLVSRDVANVVFPLIFRGLKSLSANDLSADLLRALLNTTYPWRHASYVR